MMTEVKQMKKSIWKRPGWYFFLVLAVLSIVTLVQAGILGVLPVQYLAIGGVVVALVDALLYLMLVSPRINKVNRVLGFILCVAIIAVFAVGNVYLFRTNTVLDNISHEGQQKNVISVIVMDNSDIQRIEDIQGAIGMAKRIDTEGTQGLLKDLKDKSNLTPQTKEYNSLADLANGLYGSDCDAIILNESYRTMISDEEKYEDFDKETRVIYSYTYYTEIQQTTKNVNVAEDPFTVLVSGIDTYGAIGTTSRSDVNMLVTVNPTTKCIQLVSIPRDYYVQTQCDEGSGCAVGEMDKLTHTGLHGVDTTKHTLENLFGIEINYTLRVNFYSVEEIVDALGGITVNNTDGYAFSIGGYDFTKDMLQLNGEQALMFSRERKSFAEGDRERGRNQMRVIQGMIDKATSSAIVTNYISFLNAVEGSFETDMSAEEIKTLVQAQISNMGGWNVGTMSVDGTGGTDFCYELQNNAYVMYPDMDTVDAAVKAIQDVQNGLNPTSDQ